MQSTISVMEGEKMDREKSDRFDLEYAKEQAVRELAVLDDPKANNGEGEADGELCDSVG